MTKHKKIIIFDFDGVLADSFNTFYPLLRDAMKSAGLSLTKNQYRNLFTGNVHQGFKDFTNDERKYEAAMKFRSSNYDKYYYDEHRKVKLFPGAIKFLKKTGKNYLLAIASSGREDNIKDLLEVGGVKNLFSLILANSATSKAGMIKEILYKLGGKAEASIMITDTVGDILTAKKSGLKTIAVTWGFHSEQVLLGAHPDYIAKNFNNLAEVIDPVREKPPQGG